MQEAQHAAEDRARLQQQSAIGSSLMGRPQQAASQSLLCRSNSYSEGTQQRPQRVKSASHVERGSGSTFMTQPASKQVRMFGRFGMIFVSPKSVPPGSLFPRSELGFAHAYTIYFLSGQLS